MKAFLRCLFLFFIGLGAVNAQEKVQDIIAIFQQTSSVDWSVPLSSSKERLSINWSERKGSYNTKGYRSFVGYYGEHFVGVISFDNHILTGELLYGGTSYQLTTTPKGFLEIKAITEDKCGRASSSETSAVARNFFPEGDKDENDAPIEQPEIHNSLYPKSLIHTDGVFRHYRLALPVDYSYYNSKNFNRNINRIRTFWYATLTFLNELYRNDVGVDFELIDDDNLIITSEDKQLFPRRTPANTIVDNGTITFNKYYSPNKYDLAVIITDYRENYNGLASVYAAYEEHRKANAAARPIKPSTIAHEIGHMFGADHTFSNGGQYTDKTETGSGQSIMSYGHEYSRDFFSLISLQVIRAFLGNSMAYYADRARSEVRGKQLPGTGSNLVYGVKSNNQPPKLETVRLKKEYTIPEGTFFQFYLTGSDPEGDELTYIAHPADRRFHSSISNARFLTYKGTTNPCIRFQEEWVTTEPFTFAPAAYTQLPQTYTPGNFTFWLGVADHNLSDPNHLPKYDVAEVKLHIVKGKPFEIKNFDNGTYEANKTYQGGQSISIQWEVDNKVFSPDTKVRILLSDDSGKTYKYILVNEAPNNGECQITLPNIDIGATQGYAKHLKGKGIIKVEVIDGLAYALSTRRPYNQGGFMVSKDHTKPDPLQFVTNTLPKDISVKSLSEVPTVELPSVTGGCKSPQISYKDTQDTTTYLPNTAIKRVFVAEDSCGQHIEYTQMILIGENKIGVPTKDNPNLPPESPKEPLTFITSTLPNQWSSVVCPSDFPSPAPIETKGGCGKITSSIKEETIKYTCKANYIVKRTYSFIDECNTSLSFEQYIRVEDTIPPVFIGDLPKDITLQEGDNIPIQTYLKAIDGCSSTIVTHSVDREVKKGRVSKVVYTWVAMDDCGNKTIHKQVITIVPKVVSPLKFVPETLPKDITLSCGNQLPRNTAIRTEGGCPPVNITYSDERITSTCPDTYTLVRSYKATDYCGTSIVHRQNIKVSDTTPPTFVGDLPRDITLQEGDKIPTFMILTATDNCSNAIVTYSESREIKGGKISNVVYTWVATDACGNKTTHKQVITIVPKVVFPLKFVPETLPKDITLSCGNQLPRNTAIRTEGGCPPVNITYSDERITSTCPDTYTLVRSYKATDYCGTSIVHRQNIKVSDTTPPTFVGDLPRDITLQEGDKIPTFMILTATDNCSNAIVTYSESREIKGGKISNVVYTWVATDACGNKTTHKQVITIVPKSSHIPDSASTERREEIRVYNAVSTESGSENYFKVEYTDPNTLISVVIFNEMGLQVYASDHYQENGEIFRGYANVSGVVGTGQRLPSGTYFYILTYFHNRQQEVKKGFLYVK